MELHGSGTLALSLGPDTPPTVPPTSPPSPVDWRARFVERGRGIRVVEWKQYGNRHRDQDPASRPLPPVTTTGGGGSTGTKLPPSTLPPAPRPGPGTTGTGSPGYHGNGSGR